MAQDDTPVINSSLNGIFRSRRDTAAAAEISRANGKLELLAAVALRDMSEAMKEAVEEEAREIIRQLTAHLEEWSKHDGS